MHLRVIGVFLFEILHTLALIAIRPRMRGLIFGIKRYLSEVSGALIQLVRKARAGTSDSLALPKRRRKSLELAILSTGTGFGTSCLPEPISLYNA